MYTIDKYPTCTVRSRQELENNSSVSMSAHTHVLAKVAANTSLHFIVLISTYGKECMLYLRSLWFLIVPLIPAAYICFE